jgi:lipoprotein-anchoring transpeptidase ErfK/SrfK
VSRFEASHKGKAARAADSCFRRVRAGAVVALALLAAGCVESRPPLALAAPELTLASAVTPDPGVARQAAPKRANAEFAHLYRAKPDEKHPLPATDIAGVDSKFFRTQVDYPRAERPGTIVVDPTSRFLYLVQEGGKAMRYGVGVGKAGMAWAGKARVGRKAQWPRWTPTPAMIARDPERNEPWKNGMEGGLRNPLGPRALYLFEGGRDTLYRIHGTNEPDTIGRSVSSGCIRMFNQDVIDLYDRVPVDSAVVVLPKGERVEPARETVVAKKAAPAPDGFEPDDLVQDEFQQEAFAQDAFAQDAFGQEPIAARAGPGEGELL